METTPPPPDTRSAAAAGADPAAAFPEYPVSWYYFASAAELRRGPVSREIAGRRLVAFRTAGGRLAILAARCAHLGADLGFGCVRGEAIRCPFHHWEYDADGVCRRVPGETEVPAFARQAVHPAAERHGHVYVFLGPEPLFPLPFYPDVTPDEVICGRPYTVDLDCPWYMVGANAFDAQHFRGAHDRELRGEPWVECPGPFARRAGARFGVVGDSLQDRLTRLLAGDEVELAITDHAGNFLLATATFRRTRTYGMVVTMPLPGRRVRVRVFVMKRRSGQPLARVLIDPLSLAVRRQFINRFLGSDIVNLQGVDYDPARLVSGDRILAEYFRWLAVASRGQTAAAAAGAPGKPPC
jgi:phenylpropionate dioxygenase-like ring-hydroxylating dioxygenase large terminal subunit